MMKGTTRRALYEAKQACSIIPLDIDLLCFAVLFLCSSIIIEPMVLCYVPYLVLLGPAAKPSSRAPAVIDLSLLESCLS